MVRENSGEMSSADQAQLSEFVCGSLEQWLAADRVAGAADAHAGVEFVAGVRAQAGTICLACRQRFPALIVREVFGPDGERHSAIHLAALVVSLVEGALADHIVPGKLPPVDWAGVFVDGAAEADEEYRAVRQAVSGCKPAADE
jgi:hypothetical protein